MSRPKPRKWVPKHPEKYAGDVRNIIARSSWEIKLLNWLDNNDSVLMYASEEFSIQYFSPVTNSMHRYFPDFLTKMKLRDGSVKTFLIEVKPFDQCSPPKQNKNKKQYLNEICTWKINEAKWEAARVFCKKNNIEFILLTEYDLGIKNR